MARAVLTRVSIILGAALLLGAAVVLFLKEDQAAFPPYQDGTRKKAPPAAPKSESSKPAPEDRTPAPKAEEPTPPIVPLAEHHFDFKTPESYARFRELFKTRLSFGLQMQHEKGRVVFRRASEKRERPEDSMHIQADTLTLGKNWQMHARVDLRIGVDEVEAGTQGKQYRRADFHMRFMTPDEKPRDDCDAHPRFYLGVLTAYSGFFTCALRGHRQFNNGEGRDPGIFAGTDNPGIFGDTYLAKGKVKDPATADGKYDVRLMMREDEMVATLAGQVVFHATLPPPAVDAIAKCPPAFYFGCSNETREIFLDELHLRIMPPQPEGAGKTPAKGALEF